MNGEGLSADELHSAARLIENMGDDFNPLHSDLTVEIVFYDSNGDQVAKVEWDRLREAYILRP